MDGEGLRGSVGGSVGRCRRERVEGGQRIERKGGADDGVFMSLHCSYTHTLGMAQAAELQQRRDH